jgi:hypothetical protein
MAKKPKKAWVYAPKKPSKAKVPDDLKAELDAKATKLVENVLKPMHVKPPPEEAQFNYIIDLWTKWQGSYFYCGATYACPGPNAISPSFETKFARMAYIGGEQFALAYLRHNDKWFVVFPSLTLDECLEAVGGGGPFQP